MPYIYIYIYKPKPNEAKLNLTCQDECVYKAPRSQQQNKPTKSNKTQLKKEKKRRGKKKKLIQSEKCEHVS